MISKSSHIIRNSSVMPIRACWKRLGKYMAGSGGGPFRNRPPERLTELVHSKEVKEFDAELSQFLGDLLSAANSRDVPLVNERLTEIRTHLEDTVEDKLDMIFGGSVAKHTWVDGLSDIDSLLIINDT